MTYPLIQLVENRLAASGEIDWVEAAARLVGAIEGASEFISQSNNIPMYRGFDPRAQEEFLPVAIIAPRADRRPADTHLEWHNLIDGYMMKRFGHKFRSNALFCTGDLDIAQAYGKAYIVIPFNPMKFVWSPAIDDLANNVQMLVAPPKDLAELADDSFATTYTNTNLAGALTSNNEIMVYSPRIAMLNAELQPFAVKQLVDELNKLDDITIPQCKTSNDVYLALIHTIYG